MNMKKKFFLITFLIAAFCCSILCCSSSNKIAKGREVEAKIEEFRNRNGKLPNSLSEVGITETESGPIHYEKESDSKYILWFGKELGESVTYDSDTKQWR